LPPPCWAGSAASEQEDQNQEQEGESIFIAAQFGEDRHGDHFGKTEDLMGVLIGLKAFAAAVLGGIGSVTGAVLGGFILGAKASL
jgi:hypothetical protein